MLPGIPKERACSLLVTQKEKNVDVTAGNIMIAAFCISLVVIGIFYILEAMTNKGWYRALERSFFFVFGMTALTVMIIFAFGW